MLNLLVKSKESQSRDENEINEPIEIAIKNKEKALLNNAPAESSPAAESQPLSVSFKIFKTKNT